MRAVEDPSKFIRANLEAKPSGLRHLLREMQTRKRQAGEKRDKALVKEVSPSAYDRLLMRQRGENPVSLERESKREKEIRKIMRLND